MLDANDEFSGLVGMNWACGGFKDGGETLISEDAANVTDWNVLLGGARSWSAGALDGDALGTYLVEQ